MPVIVDLVIRNRLTMQQFECGDLFLQPGDHCIVEGPDGVTMASVTLGSRCKDPKTVHRKLSRVLRKASQEDLAHVEALQVKEREAFTFCLERILSHRLLMKLVMTEFLFDERKAYFYFTAERRVDFRGLVRDLARRYRTRIEMRQIGLRDKACLLGGFGPCGRAMCCTSFLTSFKPVSIKMAKRQGLSLNVHKLTGMCGRLKCCVAYEDEAPAQKKSGASMRDSKPERRLASGE